jgi:hypothetical protein
MDSASSRTTQQKARYGRCCPWCGADEPPCDDTLIHLTYFPNLAKAQSISTERQREVFRREFAAFQRVAAKTQARNKWLKAHTTRLERLLTPRYNVYRDALRPAKRRLYDRNFNHLYRQLLAAGTEPEKAARMASEQAQMSARDGVRLRAGRQLPALPSILRWVTSFDGSRSRSLT